MLQVSFPGDQIWGIEICVQEFYWDKTVRYNLRGSRGSECGWRERLSCVTVARDPGYPPGELLNWNGPSVTNLRKGQNFGHLHAPVGCWIPYGSELQSWIQQISLTKERSQRDICSCELSAANFPSNQGMSASVLRVDLSKPVDSVPFLEKIVYSQKGCCSATFVIDQGTICVGLILNSVLFQWGLCQSLSQ